MTQHRHSARPALRAPLRMMVLRPVTPENYESVLDIRVSPAQERFVAPVTKSLADAFVYEGAQVRIGYENESPVGFVLAFPFERANQPVVNIARLLIDERCQQRGLGRALLTATLDWVGAFSPRPARVRISTKPDNDVALTLYRSAGFVDDGVEEGEIVLWLELETS